MVPRTIHILLGVLLCTVFVSAQSKFGFNQVLAHLGTFQSPEGGFLTSEGKATADATANALLLSSLYGLNSKINTVEATKFLASLENKDAGYGLQAGAPSTLESTRDALFGLARLNAKTTSPSSTANFIKGLHEPSTGLFAARVGEKGTLQATATAFQALDILGELKAKWVQDTFPAIKGLLKSSAADDSFSNDVSANYYGIVAATTAGYEFPVAKFAKAILDLQSPQGLFYTDASKTATSYQATADAISSLYLLGNIAGQTEKYVDKVNLAALRSAVRYIPVDVSSAANAHLALALTKGFRDNFVVATGPQGASAIVIEGTQVRPALAISAKESGGVSHGGFEIASKHTFFGKEPTKGKLNWNQETQTYSGEPLNTNTNFGPLDSAYTVSVVVPGVGPISFEVTDTKHIGYGIVVRPKATIELSGRDVKEGEQVTSGTDFQFDVSLSSQADSKLVSGKFVVTFSVLDSSNVVIHEETIDGAKNTKAISFAYTLASSNIPAGKLSFRIDVASTAGEVAHTSRTVAYLFGAAMVASNIHFESGKAVKIGDTVKLSFEPATFPDLRTPNVLGTKNAKGGDATASRHFFLDIKSAQGTPLRTVQGTATGTSKYTFQVPVEATFDSLGVNVLSFRYKPATGEDVILQNFDGATGELYEDNNLLSFTVNSDLSVVDVAEQPRSKDLFYGDAVNYKFKVKDAVSGQYVVASGNSPANVYLEVQHEDESRTFTSVNVPAVSTTAKDYIVAHWTINPNAHRGNGILSLSVQDADGKKISLKNAAPHKVSIGGDITVEEHTLSTSSLETTSTVFVIELGLFCRNKTLKDAQLRANVVYEGATDIPVAVLPVAHHDGRYTVSWSSPHKDVRAGTYKVNFYREVDRVIANERKEQREKKLRKEKQQKGESGDFVQTEEVLVEPIFTVKVPHSVPRFTKLPVKAEFLALILFGSIVVWLINKRSNLK